jgi:hypothetical protein
VNHKNTRAKQLDPFGGKKGPAISQKGPVDVCGIHVRVITSASKVGQPYGVGSNPRVCCGAYCVCNTVCARRLRTRPMTKIKPAWRPETSRIDGYVHTNAHEARVVTVTHLRLGEHVHIHIYIHTHIFTHLYLHTQVTLCSVFFDRQETQHMHHMQGQAVRQLHQAWSCAPTSGVVQLVIRQVCLVCSEPDRG